MNFRNSSLSMRYMKKEKKDDEMISDFEDDTHYCLKCHSTIIGLDNYVNHRKSKCGKVLNNVEEISKEPVISPQLLQPDESFTLKADDFFSSLELQSSSKKISNTNTGGKTFNGVLTRSKASAVIQASNTGKDFNYLEPTKQDTEWLTDHSMKNLDLDGGAVRGGTTSRHNKKDESNDTTIFEDTDEESDEFDFDDEDSEYDDDDDNAPPRTFTGGKWKPTSSPIPTSNEYSFWNVPPPHHTGAKWKPQITTNRHSEHLGGKTSTGKVLFNAPPPNFTGSKWTPSKTIKLETNDTKLKPKPRKNVICEALPCESSMSKWLYTSESDNSKNICEELEIKDKWKSSIVPDKPNTEDLPSPFYTKGKWKPLDSDLNESLERNVSDTETGISPLRKSSGTVQYWCGPCNRRLASKIVYERHLKSELHFKRTLRDRELEDSPYMDLTSPKTKRVVRKITYNNVENNKTSNLKSPTKTRRKIFVNCLVCDSRVNTQLVGKHLISHYHCLKGDITLPESRQMVLDNIHSVVLQSPFQCSPCKFYCNTHDWFLHHWRSDEHKETVKNTASFFWCTECKFEAASSDDMYNHLISMEHKEMISVINRSVPVIIKKLTPIKCLTCNQQFLYNIQLRKHCERENHLYNETGTDEYQNKHKCCDCGEVLKSKIAYQRHRLLKHREKFYICSVCSLNFGSIEEAKLHRRTPAHRIAFQKKRHTEGRYKDISKLCQYCSARFENIIMLKEHLKEMHPDYTHSCPHCAKVFTISQDLTVHVRTKACTFDLKDSKTNECDQCQYKTDSTSEYLFHKVLHSEPFYEYLSDSKESKRALPQYKCPICEKLFAKPSLRCHLRIHTKERPYICTLCNAGFVRKSNWVVHMTNHDRSNMRKLEKANQVVEFGALPFLCSTCGASFKKKSILQQHMTKHTGRPIKCHHSGCIFSARFPSELKTHLLSHSDEKPFLCKLCDYQGKTKRQLERHMTMHGDSKKYKCSQCSFTSRLASHLKRHLRLHTGAKPFVCPHCNYCCNNLENLRKHILSTNKHPGKCIYECKFCQTDNFESNFAKEFRIHLVEKHPETFVSGREAATYIAGIYEACHDGTSVQRFTDEDKERSSTKSVLQRDEALSQFQDSIQQSGTGSSNIGSTLLLTSVTTQDSSEHKIQDELFPMLIVSKDVICIENPSESWNIGGSYDVEESGSLVPFHSEGESLFHEHFQ
ncbi:hypothetical protein RN001_011938 [Aquatica leii]|uniref:C2H2-type domain-containing protein n=1 Tax=Aquatica leii TaxID=1421715 RepID=A0AAN7P555_9COLE|nr:hypothetical protein RN001_011938 [Aquatica leii]